MLAGALELAAAVPGGQGAKRMRVGVDERAASLGAAAASSDSSLRRWERASVDRERSEAAAALERERERWRREIEKLEAEKRRVVGDCKYLAVRLEEREKQMADFKARKTVGGEGACDFKVYVVFPPRGCPSRAPFF